MVQIRYENKLSSENKIYLVLWENNNLENNVHLFSDLTHALKFYNSIERPIALMKFEGSGYRRINIDGQIISSEVYTL